MDIAFLLNGEPVRLRGVDPLTTTLDWLREARGLTGTKEGCNEGDCGACTVMLTDGASTRALNACLLFLPQLDGKALTTIEGLAAPDGTLHPVQQAMIEHHGAQCGFCTPGIVMSLAAGQASGEHDVNRLLSGNLCRCTGYAPIARAAEAAFARPLPEAFSPPPAGPGPRAFVEPELPDSIDALAARLVERPETRIVAGATDLGLRHTKALEDLGPVVFVSQIEEMARIETSPYMIRIGAAASIEALRKAMRQPHPHFAAMLDRFASAQVRAAATVGGNIANGSPIGDTPPPLIALGASLLLRRGEVSREIPLEDFFIEYGRQDRAPGEFIEAIVLPHEAGAEDRLRVYKISKRFDQDISSVLGAFNIVVNEGKVQSARIAFGGMAGVPKRALAAERALVGAPWSRETVEAGMAAMAEDFTPLSDHRASAAYRLLTAANLLLRYWLEDQGEPVSVREVQP
ncbi:MAG: xanthine dehydrogenase small subunit [Alphaproteobacteria bacterium]|nr:MAG: xanthine dehydrogenase small subunit [Alphaproteobacteria bacterium]